jgi:TrmH family RNA methyltransferase
MALEHVQIVLVRPQQPGNIGLAARAISAHGLSGLTLVQPQGFDPDRARWMAPNSHEVINEARFCASVAEAVGGATRVIATTARPRRWGRPVWSAAQVTALIKGEASKTAILFGPADSGLSTEDLALCHGILTLPTQGGRSVNLGAAVGIVCAHLQAHSPAHSPASEPGTAPEPTPTWLQDAVVNEAFSVLEQAGYLDGRTPHQVHGTLYRLLARTEPSQTEAAILRGMIAQLLWWFKEQAPR